MNFDEAIETHAEWKILLRTAITDSTRGINLDPDLVERDDQCDLGKWIHGPGLVHADHPGFGTLARQHHHFHRSAAEVVRCARAGDLLEAESLLCGDFLRSSSAVISAIVEMKHLTGPRTS